MLSKFLKIIDIFGEEFEFNYKKNPRYQSKLGAFFTIGLKILLLYLFIKMTMDSFDQTQYTIITGTQVTPEMPKIDIYNNYLFPILGFTTSKGEMPADQAKFYVIITAVSIKIEFKNLNETDLGVTYPNSAFYIPCKDVKSEQVEKISKSSKHLKDYINLYGLCPNFQNTSNLFVEGSEINPPYTQVNINIYPCLETANSNKCVGDFSDLDMRIITPEFKFHSEKRKNPIEIAAFPRFRESMDPRFFKSKTIKLKTTEIYNDDSSLQKEQLEVAYHDYDLIVSKLKNRNEKHVVCWDEKPGCDRLMLIELKSGNKKVTIKRKYSTILGSLSELGGVEEIFIVSLGVIYFIFTDFKFRRNLRKEIFGKNYKKKFEKLYGNKDKKLLHEAKERLGKELQDGISLFTKLSLIKIFSDIYLQDFDKTLIPLMLLEHKQQNPEENVVNELDEDLFCAYGKFALSCPQNDMENQIYDFLTKNLPKNYLALEGPRQFNDNDVSSGDLLNQSELTPQTINDLPEDGSFVLDGKKFTQKL